MFARLRLPLFAVNLLILALAVTALAAGGKAPLDPAYLDAPLEAPGEWFDSQRAVGMDRTAYADAIEAANQVEEVPGTWNLLGPTNIGGRVADVAIDAKAADTVYAATATGGVWKSTDKAGTFKPSWPANVTQAVGALAAGSDGALYAGTGEASPGGGSITYGGTGIYRSTDGAKTWEHVGLPTSGAFGRIAVDPKDPKTIFAAASGNLYVPAGQRGLWRSTDGGDSWKKVLSGDNNTTGAVDVSIDPKNTDNILASMWDHYRTPDGRFYAGVGSAVYRSTDGGDTWTRINDVTMPAATDNGRIGVTFSPADPSRAYAIIANKLDGTFGAFFRSNDGGATWTKTPVASGSMSQSSFGWWFGRIFADPNQKDRIFVPGVSLVTSTNGGDTFITADPSVHADQHSMVWDPKVADRVYLGNDGGMYRSDNDGAAFTGASDQGWTQHYSVDVGEKIPQHVATGLQDNGCNHAYLLDGGANTKGTWTTLGTCGDGLATLINPEDDVTTYSCSQYGSCGRQRAGVPDVTFARPAGARRGWFTPFEFSPNDADIMYFGTDKVSRSTNGGTTWTLISGDLADPDEKLEQVDPHSGYKIRGVVTAIGIGKNDPKTVYAGTDNGRLWVTNNADAGSAAAVQWTEITAENLPGNRWITRITVDPADAKKAYVTYSGYRSGNDGPHVFYTQDGGASFTDLSGNLPLAPVNDIVQAGNKLVTATDVGVFVSDTAGVWKRLGTNLPTVPVTDLRYHAGTKSVTAATFGHGIQRITLQ